MKEVECQDSAYWSYCSQRTFQTYFSLWEEKQAIISISGKFTLCSFPLYPDDPNNSIPCDICGGLSNLF